MAYICVDRPVLLRTTDMFADLENIHHVNYLEKLRPSCRKCSLCVYI